MEPADPRKEHVVEIDTHGGPRQPEPSPGPVRKAYRAPQLATYGSLPARTLVTSIDLPESDRALKEGFVPVDPREVLTRVLTLPIETWSYRGEPVRHLGPMAQDFHAAFGLGADDRHIHTLDTGGVALAAIQGLHALLTAQAARLAALERECAALRAQRSAHGPMAHTVALADVAAG